MTSDIPPTFSRARKWNLSLQSVVFLLAVLCLTAMVNYLAARHFARFSWSSAQAELSPRTRQVLSLVSNEVKIILYFDQREPLYQMSWSLLRNYAFANHHVSVEPVDYLRDPGAAQIAKATYQLSDQTDRDIVIFYSQGRKRVIYQNELSDLDTQALLSGQSSEVKRTHFKGELMFTSALFSVINPRQHKAYVLQGHGEHGIDSDDGNTGYSKFGGVLRESAVPFEKLELNGPTEVPADCNLLLIAGPATQLLDDTLEKIDRYLKQGGRLLVLFNFPPRRTGLEQLLGNWGVAVGNNVIYDAKAVVRQWDMVISTFSTHPLIKPLYGYQLYLLMPRSIESKGPGAADGPQVEPLFYTTPAARIMTEIRPNGLPNPTARDAVRQVPLAVAVEKGGVRNLSTDRGATRIVVVGDSYFLANNNIDQQANRQFASQTINWLLARNEILSGLAPRPIQEYKLTLTASQERAVLWILLGALPGAVLAVGFLVWARRRR